MKKLMLMILTSMFLASPAFSYSYDEFKWDAATTYLRAKNMAEDPVGATKNEYEYHQWKKNNAKKMKKERRAKVMSAKLLKRKQLRASRRSAPKIVARQPY